LIWGSGEILSGGMVSDLIRFSPKSSEIIGEESELLSWKKEVAKSI